MRYISGLCCGKALRDLFLLTKMREQTKRLAGDFYSLYIGRLLTVQSVIGADCSAKYGQLHEVVKHRLKEST